MRPLEVVERCMSTVPRLQSIQWIVHGPPVPKQRPRVGRGGNVYTPAKSRAYEGHARKCASLAVLEKRGAWRPEKGERYSVTVHAFVADGRHGDLDNICKSVLDAANGSVWHDDKSVAEIHAFLHVGADFPRVECVASVVES